MPLGPLCFFATIRSFLLPHHTNPLPFVASVPKRASHFLTIMYTLRLRVPAKYRIRVRPLAALCVYFRVLASSLECPFTSDAECYAMLVRPPSP